MRAMQAAEGPWVAGVDGCRGGWLVVLCRPADGTCRMLVAQRIEQVVALPERPVVVAVDMPMGLPERVGIGGRPCDVAARANLGARQSSLFAVPSRAAVYETDFAAACKTAAATSDPPRKVSRQCFNLFPKIRELDGALRDGRLGSASVVECHPELAFWAMNDRQPLAQPKKVKSRPFEAGLSERMSLLARAGLDARALLGSSVPPAGAGKDDVLDAAACAWTATRVHAGKATRFPRVPELDALGLEMAIWC